MKKRKNKRVVGNCVDGHQAVNVKVFNVSHVLKCEKTTRMFCRCCKMEMDLPNDSNLIGNPFSIKELTDAVRLQSVFSAVDEALA